MKIAHEFGVAYRDVQYMFIGKNTNFAVFQGDAVSLMKLGSNAVDLNVPLRTMYMLWKASPMWNRLSPRFTRRLASRRALKPWAAHPGADQHKERVGHIEHWSFTMKGSALVRETTVLLAAVVSDDIVCSSSSMVRGLTRRILTAWAMRRHPNSARLEVGIPLRGVRKFRQTAALAAAKKRRSRGAGHVPERRPKMRRSSYGA
jgi:hypothetical protein